MDYLVIYLQYLEYEKRYSYHTINAYRRDLSSFCAFISSVGDKYEVIDFMTIRQWIIALVTKNNSPRTVNRKIAALRSYFKYLLKKRLITINPMEKIRSLKIDKNLPVFITTDQMEELLNEEEMVDSGEFKAIHSKMILEFFYMTGIRLSELIRLKDSDIDTVAMTVKVFGKRNKERIIPLTVQFCNTLRQYMSLKKLAFPNADLLFLSKSGKSLDKRWVQYLTSKKLGMVTTMKKRSPHVLRHSFATNILDNGAELNAIKEILGHTSLVTTQVYTHSSLNRIKKAYQQAHPRA